MTTCNFNRDFTEFIDAVLLFRVTRDMDSPPGPSPELWLNQRLNDLTARSQENPEYYTPEVVEWLAIASKFADLVDDRKQWLMDEIEADLKKIYEKMPEEVA